MWPVPLCCVSCSQVKLVEQGMGYLMLGGLMTATLALLPFVFRLAQRLDMSSLGSLTLTELVEMAVGPADSKAYVFFFITTVQRVCLIGLFFFMMCVAERTYKQVSSEFVLFDAFSCLSFHMCTKVVTIICVHLNSFHINPLNLIQLDLLLPGLSISQINVNKSLDIKE